MFPLSLVDTCGARKKFQSLDTQLRSNKAALHLLVSALTLNKYLFHNLFNAMFLHFCAFCWAPKHSAEVPSGVPKCKEGCDVPHGENTY